MPKSKWNPKSGIMKIIAGPIILVALLCAILVALALLQYRWSGQVSEAEHERMHAGLATALNQFRAQFQNEFQRLDFLFQPDLTVLNREDWNSYAASCENLLAGSELHLVRGVWLWLAGNPGESQLYHLNRAAQKFDAVAWPSEFAAVRAKHLRNFSEPFQPGRGLRPFDRFVNFDSLVLLHPLVKFQPSSESRNTRFVGFLMLQLDQSALNQALFPEIANKCFGRPDASVYRVAVVVTGPDSARFLYTSANNLRPESFSSPDAQIELLENTRERFGSPGGPSGPGSINERRNPPPPGSPSRPAPPERGDRPNILPVFEKDGPRVEVLAKHREGSLDTAVARSRFRNLAISFGILLLLAVSMALILVFSRRAQRLAKLQINFVAGISHELRTPLAVIHSAGDNLADGVAAHSSRKYGELIRAEARKLAAMIEQILQFASQRSGRKQYNLSLANLNDIAFKALEQTKPAIEAAGFSVDTIFDSNLPRVNVDAIALLHVIQNLIQNALKYSGESRWMMLRTENGRSKHGTEVLFSIEDKGMGIDGEDLEHIFEPFYRGAAASAAQIHGTGLGLFMAQEIVSSMGGSITAKSTRGRGSIFTIHLPAYQSSELMVKAEEKGSQRNAVQNTSH